MSHRIITYHATAYLLYSVQLRPVSLDQYGVVAARGAEPDDEILCIISPAMARMGNRF